MPRMHLEGARLLDPEAPEPRPGSLLLDGERIEAVLGEGDSAPAGCERVELEGAFVAPGFIDLHFHGELVFRPAPELRDALRRDAAGMLRHGATAFLATTVAWPRARLEAFVTQAAAELRGWEDAASGTAEPPLARPVGIHLEGPWISPQALGAQPGDAARDFDARGGRELFDRGDGAVRMVTFAPEIGGADELLAELVRRGVVPALGHSLADARSTHRAAERGARHVTHLFNAMGPLHHRRPGLAGAALADERLSCDLICDGVHVAPDVVRLAARAKREALMLITDRVDPSGPDGSFGSGAVRDDGRALRLPDGRLAGSRLRLDRALQRYREYAEVGLCEAVAACTLRPARLLGMEDERGTLRPGARADLVELDADGALVRVWLGGRPVA